MDINTHFLEDLNKTEQSMILFASGDLIRTMVDQRLTQLSYYDVCEIARAAQQHIDNETEEGDTNE